MPIVYLSLLAIFICRTLQAPLFSPEQMVIWNVGQGQWITLAVKDSCWHLDMGGEYAPWKKIKSLCAFRKNLVLVSHEDWDHISFVREFARRYPNSCLIRGFPRHSERLEKILSYCLEESIFEQVFPKKTSDLRLISNPKNFHQKKSIDGKYIYRDYNNRITNNRITNNRNANYRNGKNRNYNSRIYLFKKLDSKKILSNSKTVLSNHWVFPGDSPTSQERSWSKKIEFNKQSSPRNSILILGHHGSKTSSSEFLLKKLNPLLAIASSRKSKYGHPHPLAAKRLNDLRIPLITTEIWGDLRFFQSKFE